MTYNTGAKHHCDLRDAEPASLKGLLLDVNAVMHGKVVVHVLKVGPWCIRFLARAGRAARDTGGLCHEAQLPPQSTFGPHSTKKISVRDDYFRKMT